jgi:opacity protein-like surface antigen
MKRALILVIAAASLSTAAFADCTYPRAPTKVPDGNVAQREEMLAAKKQVDLYNGEMTTYLNCLKTDYDASVAKLGSKATEDQKKQMAAMYTQKNDAAVDELQSVASRMNEQIRAFKAKSAPAK